MRFAYLDGMRGIAALFVVARHWNEFLQFDLYFGHLAVDLFFLLSGVVIGHAYDEKLRNGKLGADTFMAVRFARLYPMYVLASTVCIATILAKGWTGAAPGLNTSEWLAAGMASLLFIPFPVSTATALFPLNGSVWSLFFELVTNAGYAYGRRLLTDRFLATIVAVTGLLIAVMAAKTGTIDHGYRMGVASIGAGATRATFGIAAGLLIYRRRAALTALGQRVPAWAGVVMLSAVMLLPDFAGWNAAMELLAVFIVFPVAVVVASTREPAAGLPMRTMLALGAISYPIYLLHTPVLHLLQMTPMRSAGPLPWLGAMAALAILSLPLDHRLDTPARQWLRSRMLRRPAMARA